MENNKRHFALIFRATRSLTPEEVQQRAAEIAAWVTQVSDTGIHLDPRNFGPAAAHFTMRGNEIVAAEQPNGPALTTIVSFDADSAEQAIEIARVHPGLRYGVNVEVRDWTSPRQQS
jgi:hypothetical protein